MKHPITYFAPSNPLPDAALDDRGYAAVHARQVRPTAAFEFELEALIGARLTAWAGGVARRGKREPH